MKISAQTTLFSRVSFQDKLLFTKHLHTMIKAGIPIAEALDTLVDQSRSVALKKVLSGVLSNVQNGQSLTKSLGKHPKVFDQFFISLVGIGEESGTLEDNLEFLSKQMSKDFRLRRKIKGAMMYPAIVVFTMLIMGGFISFFVLPKLVDFFESFEIELPLTTKILLFISTIMKDYGYIILAAVAVFVVLLRLITKTSKIRPIWHSFLLRIPGMGKMISYGQLSRFARNLGTLIQSGVPITKSIDITAETLSNLRFKNDLMEVSKSLTKGKNIGQTLKKNNYFEYPPLVSRMISVGEKTGKLDDTLLYLGDFYEDEVDDLSKNLSTLIEPALLIIIGLAVGFVAIAIISPIYELTGSIRR